MKIAIIYGSTTDNTKNAAQTIAAQLRDFNPELKDVASATPEDFTNNDYLFLGTSTWGSGEVQDDWYDMLPKLKSVDLSGKKLSLFGLGDSCSYSDTFVDGMGELYDFFSKKNCNILGAVGSSEYSFDNSLAVIDGKFVGLPLDEDNEGYLTEKRITNWLQNIQPYLK
ncbi:MAG: flavodoxin FldA [Proteiniphilum sp.]|nr:flavodoxin FldA [Proteiniphilum sp.]MDD3908387.1 flavodoxin FldA [Proteiniphilum sp.]MDD4415774.1 flavodoxin FldA [Proteiniphilum sp.]